MEGQGGEGVGRSGREDAGRWAALTALTRACGGSVEAGGSGTGSSGGDDGDSGGRSRAGRSKVEGRGSGGKSVCVAADTRAGFFLTVACGMCWVLTG